MSKTKDGIPRSTWYYRQSNPPKGLTFTDAAGLLGITRQSVHRTARRIQAKTAQEVVDHYNRKKAAEITWEIIQGDDE
jgi:hypothetical protein